ncbi:N-glycosyltransferase [Variibacter gotjawalensis]|uniref:N-glycosyltransferase n=1 Tax=Variibacter gotjawalensis TaxID=1333996 RepID=A0A0S3PUG2_9BRAD|nr:glycosyltransferase [Variibacter gotjawalensis]NIK49931.1 hopene-associated glycosyltransferase HpnB [Variibacter gotjawalensis]RZS45930.1 hopene-associated glycosyltransferase HpnB [Variibacter gotjawalensis]BAT59605.1 N-glycosyltransferase [Variibacter gotjawalensis]
MINGILATIALGIWTYLLTVHGRFWLGTERDDAPVADPETWPDVVAVVPARDEAENIAECIRSLVAQDYPGKFRAVLVDDNSTDNTAGIARAAAHGSTRLEVVTGQPLALGWTGKLYAVKQGIEAAEADGSPRYILLTDADIAHTPDSVRWLVAFAEKRGNVLTSFMAKLRCETLAERIHIPAFIFFFQMLYPFPWVNRRESPMAAAAGGCMLVRADALKAAGGIDVIRGALIDDCSLGAVMKKQGPIWLGLTDRAHSIRPYDFADCRKMVARSAFAQLKFSYVLLLGTVLGMAMTYLVPPVVTIIGSGGGQLMAAAAWGMMALAFQPTLRFYKMSPLWGLALPGIALLYSLYTIDSAYQYLRGRGGAWKGRMQANVAQQ